MSRGPIALPKALVRKQLPALKAESGAERPQKAKLFLNKYKVARRRGKSREVLASIAPTTPQYLHSGGTQFGLTAPSPTSFYGCRIHSPMGAQGAAPASRSSNKGSGRPVKAS